MKKEATILFDYHSHNWRCGHASGEISDYIESAIALKMQAFGVSDHAPAYFLAGDHPLPQTMMAKSALPGYIAEIFRLKEEYAGRIDVRLGIEADFVEGHITPYREMLAAHPFDYVLGSVHYAAGKSIFDASRWATENAPDTYREYYRLVGEAARSGLFDILSHLTAVEAYGPPIGEALAEELYPVVAQEVAASGCIVEVNTSGYRKMPKPNGVPGDEPFPNRKMLGCLIAAGVPLTFGADSHNPNQVGYGNESVASLLTDLGVSRETPTPITVVRGAVLAYINTSP